MPGYDGPMRDSFKLSTGMKDDFDLVVDHSYFGYDANYQEGKQLLCIWEGHDAATGEDHSEKFSVGKEWTTPDLGRNMEHPKLRAPNASSIYGRVIAWAIESEPDLAKLLNERGEATESEIWNGLMFHMKSTTLHFGKNIDSRDRLMPEKFLGVDAETPATTPVRGVTQSATVESSYPGSKTTITLLTRMAQNSSDFGAFIESALDIPEVMENTELRGIVSDDSESGFYATHRK